MIHYNKQQLLQKWGPVLDHQSLPTIASQQRRYDCAVILENTERAIREDARTMQAYNGGGLLTETLPANFAGDGGYSGSASASGPVAGFDPILISLIRRNMPVLLGYDLMGLQPMTGPTGLIFAMRSIYANATTAALTSNTPEAFYNEANTAFTGNTSIGAHNPFGVGTGNNNPASANGGNTVSGFSYVPGWDTLKLEDLGGSTALANMGFSIEKVTVTANGRGLQAGYTLELAQDLKAVHGLDAETELANILSTELLAEINREMVRTLFITANVGATFGQNGAGFFNLATGADTDGRWQVEKYKGLVFQIERECNKIMKDTRRGKGNILLVSSDVGSALSLSGMLDYASDFSKVTGGVNAPDDYEQGTFLGILNGKIRVFVDPYSVYGADYYVAGYRGRSQYDAGLFYCPYVPLQMVRAIDPNTYQPKIGFKTRYGVVANPFAQGTTQGLGAITANSNLYYRKAIIMNLK
jgi:hypothetical protein